MRKFTRPHAVVVLSVLVSLSAYTATADAAQAFSNGVCKQVGITRADFLVETISTLPHYAGQSAHLDVHAVTPDFVDARPTEDPDDACRDRHRYVVVMLHGAMTEGTTSFDLQFRDYSLMERMARRGIDTFSVNLLGYGRSTRFGLNDPCNASTAMQQMFLIPNPLSQTCVNPDPYRFTNMDAAVDQLDAAVDDIRQRTGVATVNLFAWSRGAAVIGAYAGVYPEKVRSLALLASGYGPPLFGARPDPIPSRGASLLVRDRARMLGEWTPQLDLANCPGQLETNAENYPEIHDHIWSSVRDRDPIGSSWGSVDARTGGVQRAPSWDTWGWDTAQASRVTVPTLVLTGLLDRTNPTEKQVQLFNDLGSTSKVLIKIACASHQALWEGSTTAGWGGPHESIRDALVEWTKSGTFAGTDRGSFQINADGTTSHE
jgi:pimeloyl-ACP methyl ester carboxylesterase